MLCATVCINADTGTAMITTVSAVVRCLCNIVHEIVLACCCIGVDQLRMSRVMALAAVQLSSVSGISSPQQWIFPWISYAALLCAAADCSSGKVCTYQAKATYGRCVQPVVTGAACGPRLTGRSTIGMLKFSMYLSCLGNLYSPMGTYKLLSCVWYSSKSQVMGAQLNAALTLCGRLAYHVFDSRLIVDAQPSVLK